jgi:type IV pilus assembly protein PilV
MNIPILKPNTQPSLDFARGFSLVEALVALVVMSIGMLGIAALYVESLRSGTSALLRSQAVALASDMADRIRANPTGGTSYEKTVDQTVATVAACLPGGSGCTVANMAATDLALWTQQLDDRSDDPSKGRQGLPAGRGTVAVSAATPRVYTITVSWLESGQTVASTYTTRLQL